MGAFEEVPMPWKETDAVSERARFVGEQSTGYWTMTELCQRHGISRATGHKWLRRWEQERSLEEKSRAPKSCPHKTPQAVEELIVALRRKRTTWGAVTLRQRLAKLHPRLRLPAEATISDIIERHGLVEPRRRRSPPRHPGKPYVKASGPNDVWCTDFKGQFKMRDGRLCYPLTLSDWTTRYLLGCHGLRTTEHQGVKAVFAHWFREYGLPLQILSDNGCPFASQGIAGLSRLSAWWIRLGIQPIRIEPGMPSQNGRHERMHKTLKYDATKPPARNLAAQQRKFDTFLEIYNQERPHRSLEGETPASLYKPSPRPFPERLPPVEYPGHFEVRKVCGNSCIKWHKRFIHVSRVLIGEWIGLEEVADGIWSVFLGPVLLAKLDEREQRIFD
jgi:transposase InsO family protein